MIGGSGNSRRGLLRACLGLAAAAVAATAFAGAARAEQVGVEPDLNWGISQADQDRTAGAIADVGAKWVRLTVQWKYWEPNGPSVALPATGSLSDTDRSVQLARNAGAKVLIDVYNAPDWATTSTSSEGQVPKNASDFANFMRNLAAHYNGQVAAYELWNEEDLTRFWAGGEDPVGYTALLKAAYPAIKSADPAAQVVFGGLSWDFKRSGNFLQRCYDAGAQGSFDVLGIHPYPDTDVDPNLVNWQTWYATAHNWMTQYGDGAKQIWLTEFGINTSTATTAGGAWQAGVSQQVQASMLTNALQILQTVPYVGVVIYYDLRNNYWGNDNPTSVEDNLGLLTTNFTPKPAYYAFKAFAAGGAGAPPPPPPPPVVPAAPANDNFGAAQALGGSAGSVSSSNVAATKEPGEPAHAGKPGGRSIWFTWTSPGTGTAGFDTFGSAYGPGWHRENAFLTHQGTGAFCYGFYPHGNRPVGKGEAYRASVMGPGVTPILFWTGPSPGPFDPQLDDAANAEQATIFHKSKCRQN